MNCKKKKKIQIGVINSLMKILLLLKVFYKSISTHQSKNCKETGWIHDLTTFLG